MQSVLIVFYEIAMVTKTSPGRDQRWLKAAAAFAESGDVHDVVTELWEGAGDKRQELVDKVNQHRTRPFCRCQRVAVY